MSFWKLKDIVDLTSQIRRMVQVRHEIAWMAGCDWGLKVRKKRLNTVWFKVQLERDRLRLSVLDLINFIDMKYEKRNKNGNKKQIVIFIRVSHIILFH